MIPWPAIAAIFTFAAGLPAGVVVQEAREGGTAHKAGLKTGDVLLGWERAASPPANPEPARGSYLLPIDVLASRIEEAPRADLLVSAIRAGRPIHLRVPYGDWMLDVRPQLTPDELEPYEAARGLVAGDDPERGLSRWRELAERWRRARDHGRAAWLFGSIAQAAAKKLKWEAADAALSEAQQEARALGDQAAIALLHHVEGLRLQARGRLSEAQEAHTRGLHTHRALAPGSLRESMSLEYLGAVAKDRGDLAAAETFHEAARALREELAPGTAALASSWNNLGGVALWRGDLLRAEDHYRRALAIGETIDPSDPHVATNLNNLGKVALLRGNLAVAEEYFRRALAIQEKVVPESLDLARSLFNLGDIATDYGDLSEAEDYHRRALALRQKLAPLSLEITDSYTRLGAVAENRGDLATAEDHHQRALALVERIAPESGRMAGRLGSAGLIHQARGELDKAEEYYRRALTLQVKLAPGSLAEALEWFRLGTVADARGDLATAEDCYRRALAIRSRRAPGGTMEAQAYHQLARVLGRRDQREEALALHRRAIETLDAQRERLGGGDSRRARFTAQHAHYYHETVDRLLEAGQAEEAFHVVERYRARALLALLAERDLMFAADVPEDLDRERRLCDADYDRALADLANAKTPEGESERRALARVRLRQAEIREKIRAASPRLAALQQPQPLDLAATRAALDRGTLLLSYAIGEETSHLFAVGPGPADFSVVRLETNLARLRTDAARFSELLQRQALTQRRRLDGLARALSATLLAPVAERIARAERVLILPDGPLHLVPFAALADPGRQGRYLVEAKPVHVAASATVFAELKKTRRSTVAVRLVAFGDPDYSAVASLAPARTPAPELRSARLRGLELRALPASRREVGELKRLFPETSHVYVGRDATEDRAKTDGREATLLHFACHGLADERSPLDSALALSLPADWKRGQPNGLLQAWEIFEQVHIDADLVTLSACRTALGKEMSGEGILGLTRAFQYAGARSVLASLWAVNDDSTADLMRRFYRHLRDGKTKDAALRAAQVAMIRSGRFAHPGRWAAFQLIGDWR